MLDKFQPYSLDIHGVRVPEFQVSDKFKKELNLPTNASSFDFLRAISLRGFDKLKLKKGSPEYKVYADRAKIELETLKELGFVDYILLVWDIMNYCKESGIPVGLARGSSAGSLVLFLIEITQIDSIKYGLYFERFISKTRAKKNIVDGITYLDGSLVPDIDVDICYYNRPKVLKYLEEKFKGKTCKILTFNTLAGKLLIKECGKIICSRSEDEMKRVSSHVPQIFGKVKDLESTYEEVAEFKEWCDLNREAYEIALKLRGLIKNKGVHPSAMLVSYDPVSETCPTELTSQKDYVSSYDMDQVTVFSLKMDILGLRAVSVVDDVCKNLNLNINDINVEESFIYQQLQDLKSPHGLFQVEADTVFKATKKIKPKSLDELSGVLSIARPGALEFVDRYATYTNTGVTESIHPFFDSILGKTGGLCLYQESILQMVHSVGFTLENAETVRRVIGKKKVKEMAEWEQKIKDKIKEQGLDPEIGNRLWEIMDASKDYSFNRCLSQDTVVETPTGYKMLFEINCGDLVKAYCYKNNVDHFVEVLKKHENTVELFDVELEDGRHIKCSMNHKLMCQNGEMRTLEKIISDNHLIMCNQ